MFLERSRLHPSFACRAFLELKKIKTRCTSSSALTFIKYHLIIEQATKLSVISAASAHVVHSSHEP